jgi:hypothetical protein
LSGWAALTGVAHFPIATFTAARIAAGHTTGVGMERADWLEERVDSADARFLMVTAITHHRFSSPIWGAREVRKLNAELAEITKHAAEILKEHQAKTRKSKKAQRPRPKYRGVFGAPAW